MGGRLEVLEKDFLFRLLTQVTQAHQELGWVVQLLFGRGGVNEKGVHLVGNLCLVFHGGSKESHHQRSAQGELGLSCENLASNGNIVVDRNGDHVPKVVFWNANLPMPQQTSLLQFLKGDCHRPQGVQELKIE